MTGGIRGQLELLVHVANTAEGSHVVKARWKNK